MAEINPLFSTVRVLKPFTGFETRYQGQDSEIPIAFPGTLDFEAGKADYDPYLLAGVPVPMGARVVVWIPLTMSSNAEGPIPTSAYSYQFVWRLRNVQEAIDTAGLPPSEQKLYSLPTRELGIPDTDPRVIVPCAMDTVAYEQTEPGTSFANGRVNLRGLFVVPDGLPNTALPLLGPSSPASARGGLGQGVFPNTSAATRGAVYMVYEVTAAGNDLLILAKRSDAGPGIDWDFTDNAADKPFSNTYGTNNGTHAVIPGLGIFVITGSP